MDVEFYFWHDVWCGERPLKDNFPDLFRMACFRDVTVQQVVPWNGDQNHWNIIFSRSPNTKVAPMGDDMILWSRVSKGRFVKL